MKSLNAILSCGVLAIMRGISHKHADGIIDALCAAGVSAVEATFVNDGEETLLTISRMAARAAGRAAVGAGTVTNPRDVERAMRAGASFIVSPNTDARVIERTKELGLCSIPGALTPTEILNAHALGADIIKVFPAGLFGPEYFKAIHTPIPDILLAAVGNITADAIGAFKSAGACAFGISSGIFEKRALEHGDYNRIYELASVYAKAARP